MKTILKHTHTWKHSKTHHSVYKQSAARDSDTASVYEIEACRLHSPTLEQIRFSYGIKIQVDFFKFIKIFFIIFPYWNHSTKNSKYLTTTTKRKIRRVEIVMNNLKSKDFSVFCGLSRRFCCMCGNCTKQQNGIRFWI